MHPLAFFSRKLSLAERSFDGGDWELLAIIAALEEWRYLLQGAAHLILVYTDLKNLKYLRNTKYLKPRQARWALFFSRLVFHITFPPGSKNVKPDVLFHMYYDPKKHLCQIPSCLQVISCCCKLICFLKLSKHLLGFPVFLESHWCLGKGCYGGKIKCLCQIMCE